MLESLFFFRAPIFHSWQECPKLPPTTDLACPLVRGILPYPCATARPGLPPIPTLPFYEVFFFTRVSFHVAPGSFRVVPKQISFLFPPFPRPFLTYRDLFYRPVWHGMLDKAIQTSVSVPVVNRCCGHSPAFLFFFIMDPLCPPPPFRNPLCSSQNLSPCPFPGTTKLFLSL